MKRLGELVAVNGARRADIPFRLQPRECLFGAPVAAGGDHGDCVIEPNHLKHAGDRRISVTDLMEP